MVRRISLLALGVLFATVLSFVEEEAADAATSCSTIEIQTGTCSGAAVDQDSVVVGDHQTSTSANEAGESQSFQVGTAHQLTPGEIQALWDELCYGEGTCLDRGANTLNSWIQPEDAEPAEPGEDGEVVTIADVARFLPAVTGLHAEPNGWAVVDVPANFWVDVTPITVDGELLGNTAQVRFTPRAYRWDYGDGTTRATTTPGASWSALGQEELTSTATSHVYEQRATIRASIAVIYSAEYRVGGGSWTPVVGAVTGTAPPVRMLVVRERTALIAQPAR